MFERFDQTYISSRPKSLRSPELLTIAIYREAAAKKQAANTASANVVNLQRRVAGVLTIAIDVPRTGTSFEFARALVLDEETKVTFSYKSR